MSTNHNHKWHGCEHVDLKFCKECKVPYCVACGKEWKDPWYSQGPIYSPYLSGGGVGLNSTTQDYSTTTPQYGTVSNMPCCSHEGK